MRTILLYGFEELKEILAVKAVAAEFQAEVKPVWRDQYRKPIGALAGRVTRDARPGTFFGKLDGRMMVLCDLDQQLDALLPALRRAGIGPECYKAVLTAYNQEWDGMSLFAELEKERRALARQQTR